MSLGKFIFSLLVLAFWAWILLTIHAFYPLVFLILTFFLVFSNSWAMGFLLYQTYNDVYLVEKYPRMFRYSFYTLIEKLKSNKNNQILSDSIKDFLMCSYKPSYKRKLTMLGMISSLTYALVFFSLNYFAVGYVMVAASIINPILRSAMLDRMNVYAYHEIVDLVNEVNKKHTNNSSE